VTVRDATGQDVPVLVDLLRHGALVERDEDATDPGPYLAALATIEATPGHALLVAVADGGSEPIGMCQLIVFRHFQDRGGLCAELESIHVHPRWRGHGVGGLLLEAAVERAGSAGCYRVQLTSNVARKDAHRFYERHGFTPTHVGFKRLIGEAAVPPPDPQGAGWQGARQRGGGQRPSPA
jgi:GNAT superfamily N-acetyltransferase